MTLSRKQLLIIVMALRDKMRQWLGISECATAKQLAAVLGALRDQNIELLGHIERLERLEKLMSHPPMPKISPIYTNGEYSWEQAQLMALTEFEGNKPKGSYIDETA